jgi:hypothetical protein
MAEGEHRVNDAGYNGIGFGKMDEGMREVPRR